MIDAVLNSKISIAKTKEIEVNAKAIVPKNLDIKAIDLCVIIGNLINNAIEACLKQSKQSGRFIRIYIDMHKEMFYIYVKSGRFWGGAQSAEST